ncbi:helix-turn-helix domain-containing protein [Planococcus sp. A6]|uniref:helix-turn-helix domain-containing protein n=1 Tax=Planococcus sp. A6 TaxID=2992760 RepID=UPI00237C1893|nr:helix-turn-helix transcriptional regulator [Planococcus sp. A6]MDE0583542.1 helix-turn-helix domain-containing protein [Planococcus sp. A6]
MNIGSVIKYYRLKHNLTQSQLADGICSVSHLSKIESNTYTPHEETYEALLSKMGVQLKKELEHQKRLLSIARFTMTLPPWRTCMGSCSKLIIMSNRQRSSINMNYTNSVIIYM